MMAACSASVAARSRLPAPSARLMAEETPPPIAPADIICVSITNGNTSAMPASGSGPRPPPKGGSGTPPGPEPADIGGLGHRHQRGAEHRNGVGYGELQQRRQDRGRQQAVDRRRRHG